MHESYKVTHQMFFPISSPSVHLKLKILKYCNSVYLSGLRAVRSAVMRALQMTVSTRSERRKVHPLRKYTIKDTFRCLITMWSNGIAKRGLNELIFVKTSNSIFFTCCIYFFLPVTLAQNSPCGGSRDPSTVMQA